MLTVQNVTTPPWDALEWGFLDEVLASGWQLPVEFALRRLGEEAEDSLREYILSVFPLSVKLDLVSFSWQEDY